MKVRVAAVLYFTVGNVSLGTAFEQATADIESNKFYTGFFGPIMLLFLKHTFILIVLKCKNAQCFTDKHGHMY